MDLPLALVALSSQPVEVTGRAAALPGAIAPLVLPLEALPPDLRARWLLAHGEAPLAARVAAALEAGLVDEAFACLRHVAASPAADPLLEVALARWAASESARLGLPGGEVVVLGVDKGRLTSAQREAAAALRDVATLCAPIGWPRWSGQVVVVVGDGETAPLAADAALLARPALPAVRVRAHGTLRGPAAGALMRLALARCAPPDAGWPAWLEDGLAGVAEVATANGIGPLPMKALATRQQAGAPAIERLLRDEARDADLATAVCAPLMHSRRRATLPALLDALRNGVPPAAALKLAYGLTAERLVAEK